MKRSEWKPKLGDRVLLSNTPRSKYVTIIAFDANNITYWTGTAVGFRPLTNVISFSVGLGIYESFTEEEQIRDELMSVLEWYLDGNNTFVGMGQHMSEIKNFKVDKSDITRATLEVNGQSYVIELIKATEK